MARILLADDDDDMVEICSRLLPRRGHVVMFARNAAEAATVAAAERPDLILMDMRMPLCAEGDVSDLAGIDATKAIKRDPALASIPIIALTGHMMTNFKDTINEAGCFDLLPKPIENFADLFAIIERGLAANGCSPVRE